MQVYRVNGNIEYIETAQDFMDVLKKQLPNAEEYSQPLNDMLEVNEVKFEELSDIIKGLEELSQEILSKLNAKNIPDGFKDLIPLVSEIDEIAKELSEGIK